MIVLYHGTDAYRRQAAIQKLVAMYRAKYPHAQTPLHISCTSGGWQEDLERALKYPTFFAEPTVLLVSNAENALDEVGDILRTHAAHAVPDTTIVLDIHAERSMLTRKKQFWEYVSASSRHTQELAPLTPAKAAAWATERARDRGCALTAQTAALLCANTGADSWRIDMELAKLCAFVRSGAISAKNVRELVIGETDDTVFSLLDAISAGDTRRALALAWQQIAGGADPHYLLAMFAFQVRTLLMVGDCAQRGLPPGSIAKLCGLHPFVVQKSLRPAQLFGVAALRSALCWLSDADKMTKQGRMDPEDFIYTFLMAHGHPRASARA